MKSRFIKALAVTLSLAAISSTAKADYFVWQDERTGLSASYPDDWKMVNNQQPDDILTLELPSGEDHAHCFIRADNDKRYIIYPNKYRKDVQRVAFSKNFWQLYNSNYTNVQTWAFGDETGLGKGYASMQLITYQTVPDVPGRMAEGRSGILAVSNYFDKTYLVECSSTQASYDKYAVLFQSFMKTIDFKKAYHELMIGNHPRQFLNRGTLDFPDPNGVSRSIY